jgi:methionine sulfoxide reductase heme-binding subunit
MHADPPPAALPHSLMDERHAGGTKPPPRSAAVAHEGPDRAAQIAVTRAASGPPGRLAAGPFIVVASVIGLAIVAATDQILPSTSAHQAEMRIWLAARAAGFTALGLLTIQIALGLVLSHPTNKSTWKLSKRLFPWHENAWVFLLAFLAGHVISLIADPYAGVGFLGAFVPGLSSSRSAPVALGTLALWALLVTGATARYTRLLPSGAWLSIHRLSLVIFVLAWVHGLVAGTDSVALLAFYVVTGGVVLVAGAYRYWVSRAARPTFATSLPEGSHR